MANAIVTAMAAVSFGNYASALFAGESKIRAKIFDALIVVVMTGVDTFSDAKFVIATGVSIVTLLLTTAFGPLEAFLKTTPLDVRQWLICLAVSLSIVVVTEIRKAVRRSSAANTQNHPGKGDDTPEPLAQDLATGSNRAGPDSGHASLPAA